VAIHDLWLRHLLRHFVNNAIKNMPPERSEPCIAIKSGVEEGMAAVYIEDNGKGVRPEIRERLFHEPIIHADRRIPDRPGRGLMLVRFVTELHGGSGELVWSEQGKGSKFVLRLPVVQP
jgi:signal transduction histidine kinase